MNRVWGQKPGVGAPHEVELPLLLSPSVSVSLWGAFVFGKRKVPLLMGGVTGVVEEKGPQTEMDKAACIRHLLLLGSQEKTPNVDLSVKGADVEDGSLRCSFRRLHTSVAPWAPCSWDNARQ